jgi:hypothetical protein
MIPVTKLAHYVLLQEENERLKSELPKAKNTGLKIAIARLENEIEQWLIVFPNPKPGSPASYGIDSLNQAIRHIKELDMKPENQ